jgi:dihydroxyacetone kinase
MNVASDLIRAVAVDVVAARDELNSLDSVAGDGDLGITLATGAEAILSIVPELEGLPPGPILGRIGSELARRIPSTAGTLLAGAFLAAAKVAGSGHAPVLAATVADMLEAAESGIARRGKAAPGDKTMLDALDPAVRSLRVAAGAGVSLSLALRGAAEAAELGAQATKAMVPRVGRAAWLAERSAGHEDAGARAISIMLAAVAKSLPEQ